MANSIQYAKIASVPSVKVKTNELAGRVRVAFAEYEADAEQSTINMFVLSRFYCNIVAGSATIDIGWQAYNDANGDAVALDVDGMVDGLDVDAVGYQTMEGNTAATKLLGGNHTFSSNDGVVITVKSIAALADGDDLCGVITYIVD